MRFKTILIVGASGFVGKSATEVFLKASPKWTVSLLVRPDTLKDPKKKSVVDNYVSLGAHIIEGELEKPETYKDKLKGIDVILSTLGTSAVQSQIPLALAAKEAGVKLFAPSEFGINLNLVPDSVTILNSKKEVRKAIESAGLPYVYIATGPFYEFLFGWGLWGQDIPHHKVAQIGDRSTKITSAPIHEVIALLPAAFNDPAIINNTLSLGHQITTGEIFDELVAALGGKDKVTTKTITVADVQKQVDEGQLVQQLLLTIAGGHSYDANAIDGSKYGKKLSTIKEFLPKFIANNGPYF